MGLEQMVEMIPPPSNPVYAGTLESWPEVQRHFRGRFPRSLNEYGRVYGSGFFVGKHGWSFQIYNPHDPAFRDNVETNCETYQGLKEDSPEFYPYSFWPDADGLISVAGLGGSGVLPFFIKPSADPEKPTVVFDDRSTGFVEFPNVDFLGFLFDVLCNRVVKEDYVLAYWSGYYLENVRFEPQRLFFSTER